MGQKASASGIAGAEPFRVAACDPMTRFLYLAPGAERLIESNVAAPPPLAVGKEGMRVVRAVCISDTHNEHLGLQLPKGDLLIHSGDCMTENGQRGYVARGAGGSKEVTAPGLAMFTYFAEWFGSQDFPSKVLIGGNHDLVLQALGKARVQQVLDEHTTCGKCVYLEHEEVCLGGLRVFGSPFAYWGGKNIAFMSKDLDYTDVPVGVQVMVTHMPAILPCEGGQNEEDLQMTRAMHRTGAVLHVSGHCHWAHGLYQARGPGGSIPCVVASVCGGEMYGGPWRDSKPHLLASVHGVRGDPMDRKFGGYNLNQLPVVCDLEVPPLTSTDDKPHATLHVPSQPEEQAQDQEGQGETTPKKPALLFFGPPNDPAFVRRVLPRAQELFDVDVVDSQPDGMKAVGERPYAACLAKLGTEGNESYPFLKSLRELQGDAPFVAIHSITAAEDPRMRDFLARELKVNMFVVPDTEEELFRSLERLIGTS